MLIEQAILQAYITTVVSEIIIIIIIILAIQRPKKIWQWILAIILINSITHPFAMYFLHVKMLPYFFVEFLVFLVEMLWYLLAFKTSWQKSFALSLTANMFSIVIGITIRFILGLV